MGAVVQLVEYRTRNQEVAGSAHTRSTASNLEQVANLLCAQANSASYLQTPHVSPRHNHKFHRGGAFTSSKHMGHHWQWLQLPLRKQRRDEQTNTHTNKWAASARKAPASRQGLNPLIDTLKPHSNRTSYSNVTNG